MDFDKKSSIGINEKEVQIRTLTIKDFSNGQIFIPGDKIVDLEEEFKEDSEIKIIGENIRFNKFSIDKNGINISVLGSSNDIKVNKFQKRGTWLDWILKNKLIMIIGIIIIWAIDKLFTYWAGYKK